jgi:futalosine hydrolase
MILIVSATQQEVKELYPNCNLPVGSITRLSVGIRNDINVLITGVGSVPTTFHLLTALSKGIYTSVINLGIAGSFTQKLSLGDVVVIEKETFGDYGIDDNGQLYSLFEKKLANPNQFPFENGWIHWTSSKYFPLLSQIPKVRGVTVSTASGSVEKINKIKKLFSPDIETMEGAAVFYTCSMKNVPYICLRGISNMVEPRNVSNWNLPLAINNVCLEAKKLIEKLP